MAFTVSKLIDTGPRGSLIRASAELANAAMIYALSRPLSDGGIGIGTTVTKVRTNATITSVINGEFFSKASTDDFWTLSGTTVAASSWQKYLLLIDSSGNASIAEGTQSKVSAAAVTWTNLGRLSRYDPFFSAVGSTKFIAGVLTVATSAAGTFIPGTTGLDAAQVTDTYLDGIDQSILPLLAGPTGTLIGDGA